MKRGRPKLYPYTNEQIIEDYLFGLSAKESAERLGIPTFIVFSARSNLKLPSLHQFRKKSVNRIDVPETLINEYKKGSPISLLVEKYKIGKDVITKELKLRGIQIRRGRHHKHLDNHLIVSMYKNKYSLRDIASELNVSVRTIIDRLADAGIDVSNHPKARKNPYHDSEYKGDEEYFIEATGDVVTGDEIRFPMATFTGSWKKPVFKGFVLITGKVIKESYGDKKQQHTFTLLLESGEKKLIKGRNIYRHRVWRKPWSDEELREETRKEKHERGKKARYLRRMRIEENPVFGHEHYVLGLPEAKNKVAGLKVLNDVPNTDSIPATLNKFLIVPEIKEVPITDFQSLSEKLFYSKSSIKKAHKLAADIAESGKIKPLIVVVDTEGPYILEGVHRLAALHILGKKSFPALVVIDRDICTHLLDEENEA